MSGREHEWIEKYRAAVDQNPPRTERRLFRTVLAAITLTALCLGSALYVFSVHLGSARTSRQILGRQNNGASSPKW